MTQRRVIQWHNAWMSTSQKLQYDGSLGKLKFRIVVGGGFHNK